MSSVFSLALLLAATDDFVEACESPIVLRQDGRLGSLTRAPSSGVVTAVGPGQVRFQACAYENHEVLKVDVVVRGAKQLFVAEPGPLPHLAPLASGGTVTFDGLSPAQFFARHPSLYEPKRERVLLVVDVEGHQAARFEEGVKTHTWEVGRGQAEGRKRQRGDLKTPRGLYFVTTKSLGPFSGPFAGYYGGHWIKVNYPNGFDARAAGFPAELVTSIEQTWWRRALTPQNTALGGGIGFHGWIAPWTAEQDGFGLSWGCVVAHPEDVAELYGALPVGAAIVLR